MTPLPSPGAVRLQVADLDRSLAYYERTLGMQTLERADRTATLGAQGSTRALIALHERPGAGPVRRGTRLGLFHFALLLPTREDLGRLVAHLARLGVQAGASDHGVSEALYLWDPDGLGIEVYADRPRAQWPFDGDRLAMGTEPLDLPALLRAAGAAPWTGMPAGTVMGHVHFHVGDLATAAAFYGTGLGLDATVTDYPGALFLAAGGYHHHVGLNTWAGQAPPPAEDEARLLEWEWWVATAAEAAAVLARLPAEGDRARDPWGTVVRVRGR